MKICLWLASFVLITYPGVVAAQDQNSAPPPGQNSGNGGGWGRGGGWGGRGGEMGRGLVGTVTEVAADHYTIKTDTGEVYTVHLNTDTRITKQPAGGPGGGGYDRESRDRTPPPQIKVTDIKVGDTIRAAGDLDTTAASLNAARVMLLDAETAARLHEMDANFGKTWLAGKVTAISGTTITLTGALDHAAHTVVADENTTFRRRRDPVTLADIQVGDMIRAEGAVKNGVFTATEVGLGGMGGGTGGPGGNDRPGSPAGAPPQ